VSVDQLNRRLKSSMVERPCWSRHCPLKKFSTARRYGEGVVHVFDLEGHSRATRAYAWSSPVEGSDKRRFYAVLHLGGIRSPLDAVRAAIIAERHHG
jgi:hypothetical protein